MSGELVEKVWEPITRIVGSLGIHTKIDFAARRVAECRSTSSIFRGYSVFMRGKDPRDAHVITSRICGICGDNHATCAVWVGTVASPELFDGYLVRLEAAMAEVRAGRRETWTPFTVPEDAVSCGFHEAVRGVLSHHVVIRDGKIANDHPYPPTSWNASPLGGGRTLSTTHTS